MKARITSTATTTPRTPSSSQRATKLASPRIPANVDQTLSAPHCSTVRRLLRARSVGSGRGDARHPRKPGGVCVCAHGGVSSGTSTASWYRRTARADRDGGRRRAASPGGGCPRALFDYIDGGASAELTLGANLAAIEAVQFRPRMGVTMGVPAPELRTSVLGFPVDMPILLSPIGYTRVDGSPGRHCRSPGSR